MAETIAQTVDKYYTLKQLKEMDDAWDEDQYPSFTAFLLSIFGVAAIEKIAQKYSIDGYNILIPAITTIISFVIFGNAVMESIEHQQVKHAIKLLEETNPTSGAVRFRTIIYNTDNPSKPYRIGPVAVTYSSSY